MRDLKTNVAIYMRIMMMIKKTINDKLTVRYEIILGQLKKVNCEFTGIL
jgi:hypothetical protein